MTRNFLLGQLEKFTLISQFRLTILTVARYLNIFTQMLNEGAYAKNQRSV